MISIDPMSSSKIRHSEELQHFGFMAHLPTLAWVKDRHGRYVYINRKCADVLGVHPAKAIGKTDRDFLSREVADKFRANDLLVLSKGRSILFSEESPTPGGGSRSWATYKFRMRGPSGLPYVCGIALEMTETNRVVASLQEIEDHYHRVTSTAEEGIWLLDARGRTTFASRRLSTLVGCRPDRMSGRSLFEFVSDDQRPSVLKDWQVLRADSRTRFELRLKGKQGKPVWVLVSANPLKDERGRFGGALLMLTDITDQKEAERQAQESRRELREYLDHMSTFNAKVGVDGRLILVNRAAQIASGFSYEALLRMNFLEGPWWSFDSEVHARVKRAFREAVRGKTVDYAEKALLGGTIRILSFSLVPVRDARGRVQYLVAEGRDITALEELKDQKRRIEQEFRLKSSFLSEVSHGLRQPLHSVVGYGGLLAESDDGNLTDDQKNYIRAILTGARHLNRFADDALNFASLEAGKLTVRPELIDAEELLLEVFEGFIATAEQKGIQLLLEPVGVRKLISDRAKLAQIFSNFLSNALKITPRDGRVTLRLGPEGRRAFRFEVADTGGGIDPSKLGRLFVEFERLDLGSSTKLPGTGLGLILCKRLAELLGGRVGVRNRPGRGAIFYAILPRVSRG